MKFAGISKSLSHTESILRGSQKLRIKLYQVRDIVVDLSRTQQQILKREKIIARQVLGIVQLVFQNLIVYRGGHSGEAVWFECRFCLLKLVRLLILDAVRVSGRARL